MSNTQADRLAEQIKRAILNSGLLLPDALRAVTLLAALAKQQASPDAHASDVEAWEQGKPDSIDRAMDAEQGDPAKLYAQANALGVAAAVSGNQAQAAEANALYAKARAIEAATRHSAPQAAGAAGAYHAWCGDIEDEATLRRASSVMQDVLTDIGGWEDKALAEAVTESKRDIDAMVERFALAAAPLPQVREQAALHDLAHKVVASAREALNNSSDALDTINIPSHLAAALSLRVDDYDAAVAQRTTPAAGVGEQATGGGFCCEHSWSAAKQLAWKERNTNCGCDHNESCLRCFPAEFRAGGRFHTYAPDTKPAQAEPADELPGPRLGYPATSRDWLAAIVDIWDDEENNAPEHRAYVAGSLRASIDAAREHLAHGTPGVSAILAEAGIKA